MDKTLLKDIILEQRRIQESLDPGIQRESLSSLKKYFSLPHSIVISGIRRSGKSTLLSQIIKNHYKDNYYYFNFEDERLIEFKAEDFNVLYEILIELYGEKKTFFLDEIQNVPKWESFVRRLQDSGCKFFITGSNASLLSRELGSKLTGRNIISELYPFSFREFLVFKGVSVKKDSLSLTQERALIKKNFNEYLRGGGMPEYLKYQDKIVQKRVYEDILYRDIVVRHEIKAVNSLRELSLYFMSNMASAFTFNGLKEVFHLGSPNTVKSYVDYLENSFLIFTINKFSYSLKKQSVAPKKVYCIDNGLVDAIAFQFSKNKGKFYENLVFGELKRRGGEIYYYLTEDGKEVDFLVRQDNKILSLIQVTESLDTDKVRTREMGALLKAMNELKVSSGLILTYDNEEKIQTSGHKVTVKPIYKWLLEDMTS
jgi:predicted AAA+ superfamily ATPase